MSLEKLLQLPMNKIILYSLAYRMKLIGYYSEVDFIRFLWANGIKGF